MKGSGSILGSRVARRLFLSFVLASLIPIGVVVLLTRAQVGDTLEERSFDQLGSAARAAGQQLLDRLLMADALLPYLAGTPADAWPAAIDAALLRTSAGDRVLFGDLGDVGALAADEGRRSVLVTREAGDRREVLLARRVGESVVVARLADAYLWNAEEMLPAPLGLCVFDRRDAALVYCDVPLTPEARAAIDASASERATGRVEWMEDGGGQVAAHWNLFLSSRFNAVPWSIVVTEPKSVAYESLTTFNRVFQQAVGISVIVILLVSISQIRRVLSPLQQLVAGTKAIAERRFKAPVALQSRDEFSELGRAMNDMADTLGRQFDTLTALAEIDRSILAGQELEQIVDAVQKRIQQIVPGCSPSVLLLDRDESARGLLYSSADRAGKPGEALRLKVPEALRDWVAEEPQGRFTDAGTVRRRLMAQTQLPPHSPAFVLPVFCGKALHGALIACFSVDRAASEQDLDSIREFAGRLAVAIASVQREQELFQRAHFDSLTGLPNRQLCHDRLTQALARARREDQKLAVLFIDLDGFKHVNDSLGHSIGDELLKETSLRLSASLRETDTVARLGGDEYVVILPNVLGPLEVEVTIGNIMDSLKWPFKIGDRSSYISASIGVTMFPDDAATAEELLRKADTAMYGAKSGGRSRHVFFSDEMDQRVHERLSLQTDLQSALAGDQLFLVYQPQLDLRNGQPICAEALLRWKHPTRGIVPVGTFLPILEETGLIESIGSWILQTALRDFASWREEGLPIERIAVNLATRQLFADNVLDIVDAALRISKVPGTCLELELTESGLVTDFELSNTVIKKLSDRGVRISIDDFGTGYSSLGYLKDLRFDTVKIDRAFINGLPDSKSDAIVRAVLAMAHSLGKEVVAEGIETEAQREQLCAMDCDIGQGFLFGRPMPRRDLTEWLHCAAQSTILLDGGAVMDKAAFLRVVETT